MTSTAELDLVPAAEEYDTAQFVTFEMAGERYAFAMERVREIIRVPELVRVPLGPPSLVGIANLRGRVLPVVNLRACLGLPMVDNDETTRVVVVDVLSTVVGLVVDRVTSVVSVDPAMTEASDSVQETLRSEMLAAVVRTPDGMVSALDVDRIVRSRFGSLSASEGQLAGPAAGLVSAVGDGGDEVDDIVELVSFAIDGQEYALPLSRVREIVQAPEAVNRVPNASDRIVGVMDLRGRLLPVMNIRRVFGLPDNGIEPTNRIVVVSLDSARTAGIVTDAVREVLRVPSELVAPLPETVAGDVGGTEVEALCRLDDGARLVSILNLDRLLSDPAWTGELAEYAGAGEDDGEAERQPEARDDMAMSDDDDHRDEELLVVFKLDGEQYAVDVDCVQEIIRVPEALIRVPNAEHYVDGLVNLRGTVLPVVDLRTRFGLDRLDADERQRIVVFTMGGARTGFIVDSVVEVTRVPRGLLEPAPELSEEQSAVISRVANLTAQRRMLLVVDADRLLGHGDVEQSELLAAA